MRVVLFSPWDNAWVPYFRAAYQRRGHEFMHAKTDCAVGGDLFLHGWASGDTALRYGARNFMFLRRYELFAGGLDKVKWANVDGLFVVNTWIKEVVERVFSERGIKTPVHLVYNGTDSIKWKYKARRPGKRIGMACHVHPKKNLPLALQILGALPEDYSLHIAGAVQDPCTAEYLNHVGARLRRKVYLYGQIPHEQLSLWWDTVDYCLSTSISEGNPNNVIEAMAKGIKPVVHSWPGAEDQFSKHTFNTVQEAADMILSQDYDSLAYSLLVSDKFGLRNIEQVVDMTLGLEREPQGEESVHVVA